MSLKLYKEKRHFDKTPEPEGAEVEHAGRLQFVIQKHHASHLHYDFRLEAGSVLKSWAVPKGPSTDPSIKRLAMMVEDHPFSYRTFEGIIPEGNYGAGKVIVWDNGTYESLENPEDSERQILAGITKGSIKFRMFGKKMRGAWALVKLNNAEEKSWLLIKEKDQYVSDEDITQKDKSVITGVGVEEIDQNIVKKNFSELEHIEKEDIPEFIKPMLATLVDKPFNRPNWIFEIKWDGYRAIADIRKDKVELYSRNNKSFNNDYPQIVNSIKSLEFEGVLDGEIVVVDENGKPDFQNLQNFRKSKLGNLIYYVFDILHLNGRNLMELTLEQRKDILANIIPDLPDIKVSTHIREQGVTFYDAAKKQGLEGIMAKKADSTYQPGVRGDNWLKIKTHLRQEAIICGFTEPSGSRKYFGALILGVYKNGELTYVGHTGSGFDDVGLKNMYSKLLMLITKDAPFKEIPKTNSPVTWVQPKMICEISFQEWTEGGNMRQPIFEGLREDKDPKEITIESPKDIVQPILTNTKDTKEKIKEVSISHPDKIFWPDEGYTKGDLANYYKNISNLIIPYLKDRPESLRRYPNGIRDEGFFHKDIEFDLPDYASSIKIYSESDEKEKNYIVCQNEETLLYMVNLGCIDINPWNSRVQNLENPDYLIFDLDPLDIGFDKVIESAIEIRKVLESIDVVSYPKTSGATGIHIYVPLSARYTHDQAKHFAEIIVNIVNAKAPEYTSVERSPSKRGNRVYLDFLQNRKGQTLAAPYTVRPKPHATVSTPLKWDEVNATLRPENFTIKNIFKRVEKVGDLWKPVLGEGINLTNILNKLMNQS